MLADEGAGRCVNPEGKCKQSVLSVQVNNESCLVLAADEGRHHSLDVVGEVFKYQKQHRGHRNPEVFKHLLEVSAVVPFNLKGQGSVAQKPLHQQVLQRVDCGLGNEGGHSRSHYPHLKKMNGDVAE